MGHVAFITGISGQDGSYLAEYLAGLGYSVHGLIRRVSRDITDRPLPDGVSLHVGDLRDYGRLYGILAEVRPDEIYHLGAQSFVGASFEDPETTLESNIMGTLNVLKAMRSIVPKARFYFAGSSEMFGEAQETPQCESTPFHPRSPYGVSKVAGFDLTRNYREAYGMFCCSGILFNHESPRRGREFVTRKIAAGIADMALSKNNVLVLGNLEPRRDWGYAGDYVRAMHLMLQQRTPRDYVIATGQSHSIKDFVDSAAKSKGLTVEYVDLSGHSEAEADEIVAQLKITPGLFCVSHPKFYRPSEVWELKGSAAKAKELLGWHPKVSFDELVDMMVSSEIKSRDLVVLTPKRKKKK